MKDVPQCFIVPLVEEQETRALRALEAGEADAHQQRLALALIIKKFSRAYDEAFVPGHSDQTQYLLGRQFVGQQITKYLRQDLGKLHPEEE